MHKGHLCRLWSLYPHENSACRCCLFLLYFLYIIVLWYEFWIEKLNLYLSSRKVTKVARTLAAKALQLETEQKSCTVMALLDGGTLRRHKSWLKVIKIPITTYISVRIRTFWWLLVHNDAVWVISKSRFFLCSQNYYSQLFMLTGGTPSYSNCYFEESMPDAWQTYS